MDAFVFPSETDTFGNVVLEATASGVPPIVVAGGGPKYLVQSNVTGVQAANPCEFVEAILRLQRDAQWRRQLAGNVQQAVAAFSWDAVFENVYREYERAEAANLFLRLRSPARPNSASYPAT